MIKGAITRRCALLLMAAMALLPMSAMADAVSVTADRLNLRAEPTAESDSLGIVVTGEQMTYICQDGAWLCVKTDEKTGYVMRSYVVVNESGIAADVEANVTPVTALCYARTRVNLRAVPSTESKILRVIDTGDRVDITGLIGCWYRVSYDDVEGYVMAEYFDCVTPETASETTDDVQTDTSDSAQITDGAITDDSIPAVTVPTATARLNLRYAPSEGAAILAIVDSGAEVTIIGESGDWYRISAEGEVGYVKKEYIATADAAATPSDSADTATDITTPSDSGGSATEVTDVVTVQPSGGGAVTVTDGGTQATTYDQAVSGQTTARVNLRVSADASARSLTVIASGETVTVLGESGTWYDVRYGDQNGYIAKAYVRLSSDTDAAPAVNEGTVAYITGAVYVRQGPGTGYGILTTLSSGAKITVYSQAGGWYKITTGTVTGYVPTQYVSSTAPSASVGKVVMSDWWTGDIETVFERGMVGLVTDVDTGLSFYIKRVGGVNHLDAQPLTASDTATMYEIYNSTWSWDRRAIWVTVNNTTYAASMNGMPHGSDSMPDNNFNGMFCIHFLNSRTHTGNRLDAAHQAAVKKAYAAGNQ